MWGPSSWRRAAWPYAAAPADRVAQEISPRKGYNPEDGSPSSRIAAPFAVLATTMLRIRFRMDRNPMIPPLKPGARLLQVDGPVIETERLLLRPWRSDDIAPNTAMLSDPGTARFITPDGKPVTTALGGWRNAAVIAGHWALHGFGMFAVEEKSSGKYVGRVGPWCPPGWPGFEVGWGIAGESRGKGYAVEAARASIDWVFATFEIDEIIHCIEPVNTASQAVARRLGASKWREAELFGKPADLWGTSRVSWIGQTKAGPI
jgi:RimJ/RimL family protein N-acetyltransferase